MAALSWSDLPQRALRLLERRIECRLISLLLSSLTQAGAKARTETHPGLSANQTVQCPHGSCLCQELAGPSWPGGSHARWIMASPDLGLQDSGQGGNGGLGRRPSALVWRVERSSSVCRSDGNGVLVITWVHCMIMASFRYESCWYGRMGE